MTKQDTPLITLEEMIDKHGLIFVLTGLETICHEKEQHLLTNWQDKAIAKDWSKSASLIYKATSQIEKLNIN